MPRYSATIHVRDSRVEAGKELEGHVIYTTNNDCKLNKAKLKLECCAYYYHKGNQRKRTVEQSAVLIPLFKRDGRTPIQEKECLEEPNRTRKFLFKEKLQQGLLPSTEGRGQYETDGQVLEVSYTLKLSSKQGFIFKTRDEDASTDITLLAAAVGHLFLNQEANTGVVNTVTRFGQGMDMMATVRVPSLVWERGETMPVDLQIARMPAVSDHTVTVYLERTIRHLNKETITDVVTTDTSLVTERGASFSKRLPIPTDTPHSGVISCPTLSVHYRVRVEIKGDRGPNQPTVILGGHIVIGTRPQQSAAGSTQRPSSSDQERGGQSQPPPSSAEPQSAPASEDGQPSSAASMANASSEPSPQPSHHSTATPLERSTSSQESSRPEATHAGPEATHGEPEATHAGPEATHGEPEATHGELEASHGEPEASHGEPEASHAGPEATHGEPEATHGEPEATHGEPEASHEEPEASHAGGANDSDTEVQRVVGGRRMQPMEFDDHTNDRESDPLLPSQRSESGCIVL